MSKTHHCRAQLLKVQHLDQEILEIFFQEEPEVVPATPLFPKSYKSFPSWSPHSQAPNYPFLYSNRSTRIGGLEDLINNFRSKLILLDMFIVDPVESKFLDIVLGLVFDENRTLFLVDRKILILKKLPDTFYGLS